MDAALRSILQNALGEYVMGLDKADMSKMPLTLRHLKLREKNIQEAIDEDGSFPFDFTSGDIGSICVTPGWGTVQVALTDIVLNLSFSPMKAMRRAMAQPSDSLADDNESSEEGPTPAPSRQRELRQPHQPPALVAPPVPPRYCEAHGTSEKRQKAEPRFMQCQKCNLRLQTNYVDFTLCPVCSNKDHRCMICGAHAPQVGNYVPGAGPQPQLQKQGDGRPRVQPPPQALPNPPQSGCSARPQQQSSGALQVPPRTGSRPLPAQAQGAEGHPLPPPPPPSRKAASASTRGVDSTQGSVPGPPPPPLSTSSARVPTDVRRQQSAPPRHMVSPRSQANYPLAARDLSRGGGPPQGPGPPSSSASGPALASSGASHLLRRPASAAQLDGRPPSQADVHGRRSDVGPGGQPGNLLWGASKNTDGDQGLLGLLRNFDLGTWASCLPSHQAPDERILSGGGPGGGGGPPRPRPPELWPSPGGGGGGQPGGAARQGQAWQGVPRLNRQGIGGGRP